MNATEIRNENWREIERRMTGLRQQTYRRLLEIGPCSTRRLAGAMGRGEPTSIRPRVTELCQMGLARCVGARGGDGLYEAIPLAEARAAHAARAAHEARAFARAEQRLLPLEV